MVATRHSSAPHGALCPQVSGWDELRSGRWRLIRLVSPVYLGRARNEAARHARGESLLVSPLYLPLSPLYLGGARGESETLLLLKDDNGL